MHPACGQFATPSGSDPLETNWHSPPRNLLLPLDCKGQKKRVKRVSGDWMKVSFVGHGAAR